MENVKLTESLVRIIAETGPEDAGPAFAIAKQGLLDYLGAAWKGRAQAETNRLLRYVSGSGQALLFGSGQGASAELSALYNGYLGHYLDYDDVNQTIRGHPSTVLYPALLAAASLRPVTGKRFLAAYVIGAEVMARLAQAMGQQHYRKGFHSTATLGVLASAMATGYLLQLDTDRLLNALGIAAAQVSGIRLNFGTESKPLQAGLAAQKGVQAALLAEAGIAAGHSVLDGSQGIFALYGEGVREDTREILLGKWGRSWELCSSGLWFKLYPFCSGASHVA
ncbi:MAG: MmgE/PrpD family protein, partial [Acidaminococcaceae bacterium]|nr:MmgE/PrpD family protein [Acidaminococcaceae bacterium]